MNYSNNSSVLNSELSVKVLEEIASSEKGDYGSNLAKKLDKSQSSIGRVITELHNLGFIKKGRREKAQYYQIDYRAIGEFWHETVCERLKETDGEVNRKKWLAEGHTTTNEMREGLREYEDQITETVAEFMKEVLEGDEDINRLTVSELLFESFAYSIGHNMIENKDFLEEYPYLEYPKDALVFLWNLDGFSRELKHVLN